MKVIDILNKIANGKEYRNCNLIWHSKITGQHMEENIDTGTFIYESLFYNDITLNDEVEIIEEKKIPEKIKDKYCSQISKVELAQKYNEIIDCLDYLKNKGE